MNVPKLEMTVFRHQDLPGGEFLSRYMGVLVVWDRDMDHRVLRFIEDLPDHERRRLVACRESKGGLDLVWARDVPERFEAENAGITVAGDWWTVYSNTDLQRTGVMSPSG